MNRWLKQNQKSVDWNKRVKICYSLGIIIKKTINDVETKYSTFYSNSKAKKLLHSDIDNVSRSIYSTIMIKIPKYQEKDKVGLLIQC